MTQRHDYHSNPRADLLPYVLALKPDRVLDVGCGNGYFGESLKENGVGYVAGIEINWDCREKAKNRLDHVMTQSIENSWFQADMECGGKFDVIVFADVIEHLEDPWAALKTVRQWLSEGGRVVLSVPNIGFIDCALKHLHQLWRLSDAGIMDKTHLRWFCREDLRSLVEHSGGYTIETLEPLNAAPIITGNDSIPEGMQASVDFGVGKDGKAMITMHGVDQDMLEQLYTLQYVCVGRL